MMSMMTTLCLTDLNRLGKIIKTREKQAKLAKNIGKYKIKQVLGELAVTASPPHTGFTEAVGYLL